MIEFIFTLDYELYGDGRGKLTDCVILPTEGLIKIFKKYGYPLVVFPEVLEFEKIDEYHSDSDIGLVKTQLREILETGNEIGLHIHSWWINARFVNDRWQFDLSQANLCSLPENRIGEIINRSMISLRRFLDDYRYQPIAFRNGLWIMQPTRKVAEILSGVNIRIDSTLFKGGRIKKYKVDYRSSPRNKYYWRILDDVNSHQEDGLLYEVPIYTEFVPFWKMMSRVFNKTDARYGNKAQYGQKLKVTNSWRRVGDIFRLRYPRKLDYCFMRLEDILVSLNKLILLDQKTQEDYKPIVLVGHTKNLIDLEKVENILKFIKQRNLGIVTFKEVLTKIIN